jgi:hypothetical protein
MVLRIRSQDHREPKVKLDLKGISVTTAALALVGGGAALGISLVSGSPAAPRPVTVQQVADTSASAPASGAARVNAPAVESASAVTTPPVTSEAPVTEPTTAAPVEPTAPAPSGSGSNPPPQKRYGDLINPTRTPINEEYPAYPSATIAPLPAPVSSH